MSIFVARYALGELGMEWSNVSTILETQNGFVSREYLSPNFGLSDAIVLFVQDRKLIEFDEPLIHLFAKELFSTGYERTPPGIDFINVQFVSSDMSEGQEYRPRVIRSCQPLGFLIGLKQCL